MIVAIGGPSGSGKTTLGKSLESLAGWHRMVTITTRPPRPGEVKGIDYYFRTLEQFKAHMAAGLIGETTEYAGNGLRYGTYHADLRAALERDEPTYVIIDAEGLEQLRKYYGPGRVVGVWVWATRENLESRMQSRSDQEAAITRRLSSYDAEMATAPQWDHHVNTTRLGPKAAALEVLRMLEVG